MSAQIHPTAVVDDGAEIGDGARVWHFCHVMDGARIGAGCILGQNVFVGRGVSVGSGTKVQNNVSLYEGVRVGEPRVLLPYELFDLLQKGCAFLELVLPVGGSLRPEFCGACD